MDIDLARTFLEIVRSGSLIAAAERLHLTQTAISARVQNLEGQLNCKLLVRNRAGARPTADGEAFIAYANQLVQTWEAAQRDLPLLAGYRNVLHIGGELSLCNPLMLNWVRRLRQALPNHAVRTQMAEGASLQRQLELGVLDAALVFQPLYSPGLQVEQLLEEKLIQVRLAGAPSLMCTSIGARTFAVSTTPRYLSRPRRRWVSTSARWPCSSSSMPGAAAISVRGWCRATWTAACWNGWKRPRSSTFPPTCCMPVSGTRQSCNRRSRCCGK